MRSSEPFIYLAPIRGCTDALMRSLLQTHFGGFDASIAPFINPQRGSNFKKSTLKDMIPECNSDLEVVPQLLHTNPEDFIKLCDRLFDLGYDIINWNLGCPAPMVTKKKRGSGLLPYPEQIVSFLDEILPVIPQKLSIKTRLGLNDKNEIITLLPMLDQFPIKEIIIHTRLGKQLYKGETDSEHFSECLKTTKHILVYNGDINTIDDFKYLEQKFPSINRWMIGRGALSDPFLVSSIKGNKIPPNKIEAIQIFHNELYERLSNQLAGPGHLLSKMKQLWQYLIYSFPKNKKLYKKIIKSKTEVDYLNNVNRLFES